MRSAHSCDDFDSLLDVAHTYNEALLKPLSDDEVVKTAKSAWDCAKLAKTGSAKLGFSTDEVNRLIATNPDDLALLAFLIANNSSRKPHGLKWACCDFWMDT